MPSPDPQIAVLIVAAGRGLRANAGARADATPKQYRVLAGKPVLARTIESVLSLKAVGHVEVVIGAEDDEAFAALGLNDPRIHHTHGGATRQESVLAGLRRWRGAQARPTRFWCMTARVPLPRAKCSRQ